MQEREEEYKKNALYEALRGQKTPLPGTRTVSTALVPQVVLPDLGGEVVHDATLVAFLVRQTLLEREEEKRKEKEEEEEERRRKALDSIEQMLEQMLEDSALRESSSSAVQRTKRKKKRKKRLPRAPRPRPVARHHGRYEPEGLLRAHRRQRQLRGQGWFYWLRYTSCVFPLVCWQARDVRHHGRYGPEGLLRDRARRRRVGSGMSLAGSAGFFTSR